MQVTINWTDKDYFEFNKLYGEGSLRRKLTILVGLWIIGTSAWVMIRTYTIDLIDSLFLIVGIIFVFPYQTIGKFSSRSMFKKSNALHTPITYEITAKAINTESKHIKSSTAWNIFTKYKSNTRMLLLYRSPIDAMGIPRGDLKNEDWEKLLKIVDTNIKGKK